MKVYNIISFALLLQFFSCTEKQPGVAVKYKAGEFPLSWHIEMSTNDVWRSYRIKHAYYHECIYTDLSRQFDIHMKIERILPAHTEWGDSSTVWLYVINKSDQKVKDSIRHYSNFYFESMFKDCNNTRSQSTGKDWNKEAPDNFFGDVIVADFNFDGKDDIAYINDAGGNSGPYYDFYLQQTNMKFKADRFLIDTVGIFPSEIDKANKTIVSYGHASAVSVCKRTFVYNSSTRKWAMTRKEFIEY